MKNIVIAGKAGSGKDTIGDWLVGDHGYVKASLAAPIKRIAPLLWPDLDWTAKQRPVLQQFGSLCRDVDPATWIKLCWKEITELNGDGIPAVVTDCRYLNELEFFRARGCYVMRVDASYVDRVSRLKARDGVVDEAALQHISETNLDGVDMPTVLNDRTIPDLLDRVARLLG